MQLGIFAKTFPRPTVRETFAAVKHHGLQCIQFNFSCAGLPTLPGNVEMSLVRRIRSDLEQHSLLMAAVSGTCNLIHPQPDLRLKNLEDLAGLIRMCPALGCPVVTLCTGTLDPVDMWRAHPNNYSPEAWQTLLKALDQILPVAQECGVFLGVEPEPSNVVDSASKARQLTDELKSRFLKIVFDAANLLTTETLSRQTEILSRAADLLGPDIVIAHAKALRGDRSPSVVAAGQSDLDYGAYVSLLRTAGFDGPLILHSLSEPEVPGAVRCLQQLLGPSHAIPHPRTS